MNGPHLRPALLALAVILFTSQGPADEPQNKPPGIDLSLSDLAPYRAALDGKPEGPAIAVDFRALWDSPGRFQGRRVRVEGRVARRFHQGAFGTFPPLVEAWAVAPSGDPFCLVFADPNSPDHASSTLGATVRFEGVFLRTVRYQGGDTARLAPLIVGDSPPKLVAAAPTSKPTTGADQGIWGGFSRLDWLLGIASAAVVMLVLGRQHLGRPTRFETEADHTPDFADAS